MSIEEFIIFVYVIIEELYPIVVTQPLRTRGFPPAVTDAEIITMQIVGEFLGLDTDKNIWMYFKNNWLEWFPKLGSYPNFCKHCANLWHVSQSIMAQLIQRYGSDNIHFIDGFPLLSVVIPELESIKTLKNTQVLVIVLQNKKNIMVSKLISSLIFQA